MDSYESHIYQGKENVKLVTLSYERTFLKTFLRRTKKSWDRVYVRWLANNTNENVNAAQIYLMLDLLEYTLSKVLSW